MRHLLACVICVLLAAGGFVATTPTALAYTPDNEELTFLALINDYREQHGLAALSLNAALGDAARHHSQDMAERNYFDHNLANGTSFEQNIRDFGYTGNTWGENIAAGMETASEALFYWQNSPTHNAGMLNPAFSEIGIGRYYGGNSTYGWYWTTTFGGGGDGSAAPAAPDEESNRERRGRNNRNNGNGSTETVVADPVIDISEADAGQAIETEQEAVDPTAPGATNADGSVAEATGDGPPVSGDGDVNVYGDINTGGVTGDSVSYEMEEPLVQETAPPAVEQEVAPPAAEQEAAPPVAEEEAAAPVAAQEEFVPPATTGTTTGTVTDTVTTTIMDGDGNATSLGTSGADATSQSGTITTDGTTTETTDPTINTGEAAPEPAAMAPAGSGCSGYASWYDAQIAYENAGGTAADPDLVNAVDPNWDGIACEELMTAGY